MKITDPPYVRTKQRQRGAGVPVRASWQLGSRKPLVGPGERRLEIQCSPSAERLAQLEAIAAYAKDEGTWRQAACRLLEHVQERGGRQAMAGEARVASGQDLLERVGLGTGEARVDEEHAHAIRKVQRVLDLELEVAQKLNLLLARSIIFAP